MVAERDYYKQQYDLLLGNKSTNEEASSNIIDSSIETTMTVEVTLDNYKDYFEFVPVTRELDNYDGTSTAYRQYVLKSNAYNDGWIYKEASADFQIEYINSSGERDFIWRKLEGISSLYKLDDPEIEVLSIKGRLKFEHISAVQSYEMDDFKGRRIVVFSDGKRVNDTISLEQARYPY